MYQYIQILNQSNKKWFFSKENIEEKLLVVSKIGESGYPSLIPYLIPYLKHSNKNLRNKCCETILFLFTKIDSKKGFYESIKYCQISIDDIDFYEKKFSKEEYLNLLAISSFNSSGYIREKAVRKLIESKSERTIPFLIYRLADWVKQVRDVALQGFEYFKQSEFIDSLLENLPLFEWLQKVQRTDLSGLYNEVVNFIIWGNREYILKSFKKYPEKLRIIIAKYLSETYSDNYQELQLLIADKHFLVRSFAINHFDKLAKNEIELLLKDKSGKIRYQTLSKLKDCDTFSDLILNFIADESGTVRNFARYSLKNSNLDFAEIYSQNLQEKKQIIGSLNGLAEINAVGKVSIIDQYLSNPIIKVQKTAFFALQKLDNEKAYSFAVENLSVKATGLRNIIIEFLSHNATSDVLKKAREIYKQDNQDLKKSMLKLFSKIGGWSVIADLVIGTIDNDETIRILSAESIRNWKRQVTNLFIIPKQEDIENGKSALSLASKVLEEKKYFKEDPLNELEFYIK